MKPTLSREQYRKQWREKNKEKCQAYNKISYAKKKLVPNWTAARKENRRAELKRINTEIRTFCQTLKENTECMDCGKKDKHYLMEFDHREGTHKTGNRNPAQTWGWKPTVKELKKVDIVCIRCHKIRTWNRFKEKK